MAPTRGTSRARKIGRVFLRDFFEGFASRDGFVFISALSASLFLFLHPKGGSKAEHSRAQQSTGPIRATRQMVEGLGVFIQRRGSMWYTTKRTVSLEGISYQNTWEKYPGTQSLDLKSNTCVAGWFLLHIE